MEGVWTKTLEKVQTGSLVGPAEVPSRYPLSRRFGIKQGQKVRCIDDFSRSSVNACVQTVESPKPQTLGVFAALCVLMMSSCNPTDSWIGRTYDLVGAYRQCPVRPSSTRFAHIVVQRPSAGGLAVFRMHALPFGAVRSVHSFLRLAASLWYILVKEFMVPTTSYFDDFVTLATTGEAPALTACIHMVLKMLGWDFAGTGVQLDVSHLSRGLVTVSNTDGRRCELVQALSDILESGKPGRKDALKLRGRLQFAAGQVFGRIGKATLSIVTAHGSATGLSWLCRCRSSC